MPRLLVAFVLCLLPAFVFSQEEEPETAPVPSARLQPKEIPKTFTEQFTVYGGKPEQRTKVCHVADDTQKSLYQALAQKVPGGLKPLEIRLAKGRIPFVIQLTDKFADGPKSIRGGPRIMPDNSFSITLFIDAGAGFDSRQLRSEMVRWLLWDFMLRRVDPETLSNSLTLELPDWLHQGCLELMEYQERGKPSELFASVFKLGKTLTIQEIINADISSLDSVSLSIYRISSSALILMMLDQPNGMDTFIACIGGLPSMPGTISEHLERFFPVLRGQQNQMEKWWSLQLAAAAEPTQSELYTMLQTEEKLSAALTLVFSEAKDVPMDLAEKKSAGKKLLNMFKKSKPEPTAEAPETKPAEAKDAAASEAQKLPLTDFSKVMDRKDRKFIFGRCSDQLIQISLRAHPFYRSMIRDYQEVLTKLADGKDRGISETLATLAKKRDTMLTDAKSVEDYMDWYEATQRTQVSGEFYDYLRSAEMLEKPSEGRTDGITKYMDALEKEYR